MLHGYLFYFVHHLDTVYKRSSTADRRRDVDSFHHLLLVVTFLGGIGGVGVNAVRALNGMRDGQGDERFFAGGQGAICKDGPIIGEKLVGPFLSELRSEERRVEKEWVSTFRSRWWTEHYK